MAFRPIRFSSESLCERCEKQFVLMNFQQMAFLRRQYFVKRYSHFELPVALPSQAWRAVHLILLGGRGQNFPKCNTNLGEFVRKAAVPLVTVRQALCRLLMQLFFQACDLLT